MNTQMEESKKSLETKLKQEKEAHTELEVRLAIVEDGLVQANESKERLSTEFNSLQGKAGCMVSGQTSVSYPMFSPTAHFCRLCCRVL